MFTYIYIYIYVDKMTVSIYLNSLSTNLRIDEHESSLFLNFVCFSVEIYEEEGTTNSGVGNPPSD